MKDNKQIFAPTWTLGCQVLPKKIQPKSTLGNMLGMGVKEVTFQIRKKMFLFAQNERDSQVKHKNAFIFKIDPVVHT